MPLNIMQKDPSIPFFFAGILVGLSTIVAYNLLLPKVKVLQKEVPHIYTNIAEKIEEKGIYINNKYIYLYINGNKFNYLIIFYFFFS